jgi:hypothetical protein
MEFKNEFKQDLAGITKQMELLVNQSANISILNKSVDESKTSIQLPKKEEIKKEEEKISAKIDK